MKWDEKLKHVPVVGDLVRILCFLYSGIHAVALAAEQIGKAMEAYIPSMLMTYFRHIAHALRKHERDTAARREKKQMRKIFNRELQKVLALHMPFFKGHIFSVSITILMIGLQMISANTTYSGSEYYMKDLKAWIPIVFTLVLQSVIILLSVMTFSNGKDERHRVAALFMAVILSISVSYVGIINGIINPLQASSEEKNTYIAEFNAEKASASGDAERMVAPEKAVSALLGDITRVFNMSTSIGKEAETLNDLADETNRKTETETVRDGISITTHTTKTDEAVYSSEDRERMKRNASQLAGNLEQIGKMIGKFDDLLSLWNASLKQGTMTEQLLMMDSDFQSLLRLGAENYSLVHDEEMELTFASISEAFDKAITYGTLDSMTPFDDSEDLEDKSETTVSGQLGTGKPIRRILKAILNSIFTFDSSTTREYAEAIRSIQEKATKSYGEITPFLSEDEKIRLKDAYDALMVTKDANYVAFSYFSPQSRYFTSAVTAMIIAILIDGGTLGLSLIKNRQEASPLYARASEDFFEEEDDLMTSIFLSIPRTSASHAGSSGSDFAQYCSVYMDEIISVIDKYLKNFRVSSCTVRSGFGAVASEDDLNLACFIPITSILMKLNYVVCLSEWEYRQLEKEWDGFHTEDFTSLSERSRGRNVYLLRSRAEIYMRQNIAQSNLFHTMLEGYRGMPKNNEE